MLTQPSRYWDSRPTQPPPPSLRSASSDRDYWQNPASVESPPESARAQRAAPPTFTGGSRDSESPHLATQRVVDPAAEYKDRRRRGMREKELEVITSPSEASQAVIDPSAPLHRPPDVPPPPPDKLHPRLSSWLKNIDKLGSLINRLQELACSTPTDHRSELLNKVAAMRAMFKKQQERFIEFLQLSEDYANKYLRDIDAAIRQQKTFLDNMEERLEAAKKLHGEAVDLQKLYESGTVASMNDLRATGISRPLPRDNALCKTPDIYASPLMDFGDDIDNIPSLFGKTAYEGYEMKETVGSHLSPSDLPLPDIMMDDMEWCSDQHMQGAIVHRSCKTCGVWPRRNGYEHCSGNYRRNKFHSLQPRVHHPSSPPPPDRPSPPPPVDHPSHLHARPKETEPIIKPKRKPLCDTRMTAMHPTLSSWLKNMDKLSHLIDRLQELASATPLDFRCQLYKQVASLRAAFKRQQKRYFEFLQLTEEYANRYLLDISTEIELQSSFLDKLEKRLDMAKSLYYQANDLRKSYESGTMNVMKSVRETALKQLLPAESDLFREVDFILGEISRCYKELDKFWKDEICRAGTAFRTHRIDPGDVERWRNFKASLEQTIKSQKNSKQSDSIWNVLHDNRPGSSEIDLGAIASSLFPAFNTLQGWLQRIHESASVECSNMSLVPILRAELGLAQNNNLCFTFFRRCVEFGEMVIGSSTAIVSHLAFSRVRASTGLLEGAIAFRTEAPDVSVEHDALSRGSREFDSKYKQALSLQQKTAVGLNMMVEIVSNWVVVADSFPDSLPYGFSLRRLRNLADTWERGRASMRMGLAALTDDPAEQLRYHCLSSTPSRSRLARFMTSLFSFV